MVGSRSAYTRKRILDTAARLFAQKGDTISLREITAEARVNLSSVNYHFGSKEGLVRAVYQQRLDTLQLEQLAILDRLELQTEGSQDIDPLLLVEAFFRPLLQQALDTPSLSLLHDHAQNDPKDVIQALTLNGRCEVLDRFRAALAKVLPNAPERELLWRFQFMLGAASCATGLENLKPSQKPHTQNYGISNS